MIEPLRSALLRVSPRTWVSAARTAVYGTVASALALSQAEATQLVEGVILGAVLADYVTWFVRSVFQLPSHLLHGFYEAGVNVFFGWLLFETLGPQSGDDGSTIAIAFVAFMLVLAVKTAYYGLESVQRTLGDG